MRNRLPQGSGIPFGFIHDEIVGEVVWNEDTDDIIKEVRRIMEEGYSTVCPSVRIGTEACLMGRWSKQAEPVYGEKGKLAIWKPKN